ncbi:MAG: hypothetical protein IT428_27960 [Planctomycetaceae bacterium]|nr:hypothetical protein [Planctomycetaceae bacterium]
MPSSTEPPAAFVELQKWVRCRRCGSRTGRPVREPTDGHCPICGEPPPQSVSWKQRLCEIGGACLIALGLVLLLPTFYLIEIVLERCGLPEFFRHLVQCILAAVAFHAVAFAIVWNTMPDEDELDELDLF